MISLEEAKAADFIVLNANPLDDINNTRKIADVYERGNKLDRGGRCGQGLWRSKQHSL
jgi:imidazolonepropionase-like amidohydrolase